MPEAMVKMVLNQRFFGLGDGFFNRLQLLHHFQTRAPFIEHVDDTGQVATGSTKAFDDCGMAFVCVHCD